MKPRKRFFLQALKRLKAQRLVKHTDMIPYDELEKGILSLPPEKMGPIFAHIHLLLGGNSVWFRHYKRLEKKVSHKMKKREEELRSLQYLMVSGDYVLLKNVGTEKNNFLTNEDYNKV